MIEDLISLHFCCYLSLAIDWMRRGASLIQNEPIRQDKSITEFGSHGAFKIYSRIKNHQKLSSNQQNAFKLPTPFENKELSILFNVELRPEGRLNRLDLLDGFMPKVFLFSEFYEIFSVEYANSPLFSSTQPLICLAFC